MKIILLSEESIRLEPEPGPMTIEALSADQPYSPFHMLASSLALCTFSILHSWGETVGIPADDLVLDVRWEFAEEPHRVGAIEMTLGWPGLPAKRKAVAERVAALCPIHATLHHLPTVRVAAVAGDQPLEGAAASGAAAGGAPDA